MVTYLQAMCTQCKRLFAFSKEPGEIGTITCSHCGGSTYSFPIQISTIEYLLVTKLYDLEDRKT